MALIAGTLDVVELLSRSAEHRPVFHAEADFRHAFAWEAHRMDSALRVRLETHPEYVRRPSTRSWAPAPPLTRREADVLAGVCEGLSNRQIAERLYVGHATVKTYVSRLLDKFGVDTRVGLVLAAHDSGLVDSR
jgi:DNA-binding NarL/FixJ family response regulator